MDKENCKFLIIWMTCFIATSGGIWSLILAKQDLNLSEPFNDSSMELCNLTNEIEDVCTIGGQRTASGEHTIYKYFGESRNKCDNTSLIMITFVTKCRDNYPRYELYEDYSCWVNDCENEEFTLEDPQPILNRGTMLLILGVILISIGGCLGFSYLCYCFYTMNCFDCCDCCTYDY